jgi:hypothetical protein
LRDGSPESCRQRSADAAPPSAAQRGVAKGARRTFLKGVLFAAFYLIAHDDLHSRDDADGLERTPAGSPLKIL